MTLAEANAARPWCLVRFVERDGQRRLVGALTDLGDKAAFRVGRMLGFEPQRIGGRTGMRVMSFASRAEAEAETRAYWRPPIAHDEPARFESLTWRATWFTHYDGTQRVLFEGRDYAAACRACADVAVGDVYEFALVAAIALNGGA